MSVLLHLRRSPREVIIIQRICDIGQIATAEVESEADKGIKLILVDGDRNVLVDAGLKGLGVALEEVFALRFSDGGVDVIAFAGRLTGVAVADGPHALKLMSARMQTRTGPQCGVG